MCYNYFFNNYGYEPSKGWDGYKKQLNEQGIATDFHDEFGFGYKPGSASPSPTPSEHEYVDLGLPSGTLWATENIKDANGNELYFAWGETQGYTAEQVGTVKNFSWGENEDYPNKDYPNDYAFGPINWDDQTNAGMTKYNESDGKTVLDAADDAATANWGSDWKMPTKEQFDELTANTTTALAQVDGVNGLLCTSTANTNTLFFPAAGAAVYGEVENVGTGGKYWSVSLKNKFVIDAWNLSFLENEGYEVTDTYRCYGFSVRPVRSNN